MAIPSDLIPGEKLSLLWILDNFSFYPCKLNECILSPKFFMKNRMTACWRLSLYPKGTFDSSYLSCIIHLEDCDGNENNCTFDSNISIVQGKSPINGAKVNWSICGSKRLDISRTELMNKMDGNDTLTIHCDIWDGDSVPIRTIFCKARTIIRKETSYSVCKIKDFSLRQPNEVYNYHIYFASQNLPLFVMSVSLVGMYTLSGGRYQIQIKKWKRRKQEVINKSPVFVSSRISLLDKDYKINDNVTGEFLFDGEQEDAYSLPYFITKKQLTANSCMYLPDDTLSLLCEVSLSFGVLSEQIEFSSYHMPPLLRTEETLLTNLKSNEISYETNNKINAQEGTSTNTSYTYGIVA